MYKYFLIFLEIIVIFCLLNKQKCIDLFESYNGLNQFDGYFYINLKNRKDRKEQILNELTRNKIPLDKIYRINAVEDKINGHLGCIKSHIKALKKAKELNLKNVVIFEDDFIFNKLKQEIDKQMNEFLEKKGDNWDVIKLSTAYISSEPTDMKDIYKIKESSTSSGYIVNKKFYNILLKEYYKSRDKLEEFTKNHKKNEDTKIYIADNIALDQHWYSLQQKTDWYLIEIGTQGGAAGESSIMS